jgi:TolB-like protein
MRSAPIIRIGLALALAAAAGTGASAESRTAPVAGRVEARESEPARPAAPAVRIMVLDLKANGVDEKLAAALSDLLVTSLSQTGRFSVAGSDDVRTLLRAAEERQLLGCESDACFRGVGEALGAQSIVHGSVSRVGDTWVMNVSRVDVDKGATMGRASEKASRSDDLVGRIDSLATGIAAGVGGPGGPPAEDLLTTRESCVWAAVQYEKDRKHRVKRLPKVYRARFGSEHFEFGEYDALEEFLPLKPDLAFLGRYPSCLPKTDSREDSFSVKEERPLVFKIGRDAAYDLVQLRRRRKLVLDVTFEIVGARIYPLKEYDWRSCDDGETPPFRASDIAPNAWIRVRSAVLVDAFHGRRYAVTRQSWNPDTQAVTLVSLPVPDPLPGEGEGEGRGAD